MQHHLTVGGEPWCAWTGCQAGRDIETKAGRWTCGQVSAAAATRAARALRPHFRPGAIKIVAGACPDAA